MACPFHAAVGCLCSVLLPFAVLGSSLGHGDRAWFVLWLLGPCCILGNCLVHVNLFDFVYLSSVDQCLVAFQVVACVASAAEACCCLVLQSSVFLLPAALFSSCYVPTTVCRVNVTYYKIIQKRPTACFALLQYLETWLLCMLSSPGQFHNLPAGTVNLSKVILP